MQRKSMFTTVDCLLSLIFFKCLYDDTSVVIFITLLNYETHSPLPAVTELHIGYSSIQQSLRV